MANNLLPPIPQTPIGEEFSWRDWFRNLGNYIQVAQTGGSPWTIVQGGTGSNTAAGARANLGISTVGHTGAYNDLTGKPTLGTMAAQNTTSYSTTGTDTTYLYRANNLSDLASAATARTNLGLGSMAVENSSSVSITGGTINGVAITGSTIPYSNVTGTPSGLSVTINTAKLTTLGTNGSMTFTNGILTSQTQAT